LGRLDHGSPQGLKPNSLPEHYVAAEAATHKKETGTDLKVGHYKRREWRPPPRLGRGKHQEAVTGAGESGEEDLGFGFDDEEGVGVGMAVGAELLEGVV
jgi:hypothetical protein